MVLLMPLMLYIGFTMALPWFSDGFTMVLCWFYNDTAT